MGFDKQPLFALRGDRGDMPDGGDVVGPAV